MDSCIPKSNKVSKLLNLLGRLGATLISDSKAKSPLVREFLSSRLVKILTALETWEALCQRVTGLRLLLRGEWMTLRSLVEVALIWKLILKRLGCRVPKSNLQQALKPLIRWTWRPLILMVNTLETILLRRVELRRALLRVGLVELSNRNHRWYSTRLLMVRLWESKFLRLRLKTTRLIYSEREMILNFENVYLFTLNCRNIIIYSEYYLFESYNVKLFIVLSMKRLFNF